MNTSLRCSPGDTFNAEERRFFFFFREGCVKYQMPLRYHLAAACTGAVTRIWLDKDILKLLVSCSAIASVGPKTEDLTREEGGKQPLKMRV